MRATASEVPEFAGAWFDEDGTVHIVLTDPAQLDRAHQVLAQADGAFAGPAVAESATFTYNELEEWHSRLAPVHNVEGVVYTGMRARRNRLIVGVADVAAHEARIRQVAAAGGIPDEALLVVETAPIMTMPLRKSPRLILLAAAAVVVATAAVGASVVVRRRITKQSQRDTNV